MNTLLKVKKEQVKMVNRRGYDTKDEDAILEYTVDEFIDHYSSFAENNKMSIRSSLTNIYAKPGSVLYVYYTEPSPNGKQQGKEEIKDFITKLDQVEGCTDVIIITPTGLNTTAESVLVAKMPYIKTNIRTYNLQVFIDDELKYDIIDHALQPEFERVDPKEARNWFQETDLRPNQLPILKYSDPLTKIQDKDKHRIATDPIVKYYGFLPGDLIKIKRNTASTVANVNYMSDVIVKFYITYRIVL